jgi:hypothetical protein
MAGGLLAALLLAPAGLDAQGAGAVKQTALARVTLAEAIAADPELRRAVVAKNAGGSGP